jgi:hypothetical protein
LDPGQIGCSESSVALTKWRNLEAKFWQQVTGQGIRLNEELASRLLGPPLQFVVEEEDEMEYTCPGTLEGSGM